MSITTQTKLLRQETIEQLDGTKTVLQNIEAGAADLIEWLHHYEPLWDERLAVLKQLAEQNSGEPGAST